MSEGFGQEAGASGGGGFETGESGRFNLVERSLEFQRSPTGQRQLASQREATAQRVQEQTRVENARLNARPVGRISGLGRSLLDRRRLEALALSRGLRRSSVAAGAFFDPSDADQQSREDRGVLPQPGERGTFLTGVGARRTNLTPRGSATATSRRGPSSAFRTGLTRGEATQRISLEDLGIGRF